MGRLGAILGRLGTVLRRSGTSWGGLGSSWGHLAATSGVHGSFWGCLVPSWGVLRLLLLLIDRTPKVSNKRSVFVSLLRFGVVVKGFCGRLGDSWAVL